jgi:hypothetical protein
VIESGRTLRFTSGFATAVTALLKMPLTLNLLGEILSTLLGDDFAAKHNSILDLSSRFDSG